MQLRPSALELQRLLAGESLLVVPGVYDALSARLVERAGFAAAFMSGFAVSASRAALPDTGLLCYAELLEQGRSICSAVSIPVLGDADTGFGNAVNVKRTVRGYADAGFAAVMIEDQVWPKRCGHTEGKRVASREEAIARVRAAVDARDEGAGVLILARTDALATHGLDEALDRCRAFADCGADILFPEAPESERQMERVCRELAAAPVMANMVEDGKTPFLAPRRLREIGFSLAAYPLSLLAAALHAQEDLLARFGGDRHRRALASFAHLQEVVGFADYDREQLRYREDEGQAG